MIANDLEAMKILFCNVGWMESYQGQSAADKIQGGGSYVHEERMGHEICNFATHRRNVYGYVRPPNANRQPGAGQIKIERIGGNQSDFVSNVLVVWTATRPEGGTVVVGWYKNAIVYRYFQNSPTGFESYANLELLKARQDVASIGS